MNAGILVGIVLLGVSAACSGALVLRSSHRTSGLLLVVFAVGLAGSAVLWDFAPAAAFAIFVTSWSVGFAGATLAHPYPIRSAVSAAAAVTVVAGGIVLAVGRGSANSVILGGSLIALALIGHLLWRYERSAEDERIALLWTSLAVVVAGMLYGHISFLAPLTAARVTGLVAFACVPPSFVLGVRRPTILDVRGLIVEAMVLEVAVIAYLAVFVGVTSTFDLAGDQRPSTGLLAIVAAVAASGFHPLRAGLRGVVDELLFGMRPDPLDAATKVADRIADDPTVALTAVREAMVLPFASLVVDGQELAASGTPVAHTRRLALALGDDAVGEMVVGLRAGDLRLSAADERVVRIVAPLLAQTLRARSLAEDLRTSRGEAITAIEEERRRIRRDLHDGLGPTLSGIAFTADAARNSLGDPAAVDHLLRSLRGEAASAIAEIRRLVYGMRPPALDELGLLGALHQFIVPIRTADGRPLLVDITSPDVLADLPAAVEVAAYRIAVEALTNVARHSGADRARISVERTADQLVVRVTDHGAKERAHWTPGVGLTSMRERAAAIGGTVHAAPGTDGGQVTATLPLP